MIKKIPFNTFFLLFLFLCFLISYDAQSMTKRTLGFYTGGNQSDVINGIASDTEGNIYAVGFTSSTSGLIGNGGFQSAFGGGGTDAFLIKFDKTGKKVWSTYFGGSGDDIGSGIKFKFDKVYICGTTNSTSGIAKTGALQSAPGGKNDGFVAVFGNDGKLDWSTYFGGSEGDDAAAVDVDDDGNVIVTGTTSSAGLSNGSVYQKSLGGSSDAYVLKMDSKGARLWSTYFGGAEADTAKAITLQRGYYIVIAGKTLSTSKISTIGTYQDTLGGLSDAFVSEFLANGDILWGTYIGGKKDDWANGLACDSKSNIIVVGHTQSNLGMATDSAFQRFLGGLKAGGGFITKLSDGGERVYSTYYGTSQKWDFCSSVVVDRSDSYIVSGGTFSNQPNIKISSPGTWLDTLAGESDAFAVKFNENNTRVWGTYYGGALTDFSNAITVDSNNTVYIAGATSSVDGISNTNSIETAPDGFVAGLTSVGNVMFNVFSTDKSVYPLKVTISYREGTKWVEKTSQVVADSTQWVVYDTKNEESSYKIKVEQETKQIYLPYEITVGDRYRLMALTWLRPNFTRNNYKMDSNTVSSIQFYISNNGIFGLNIPIDRGGLFWPRGTKNQYVFGGGIWFAAVKKNPADGELRKYVVMSYNPNNGNSWVVPGRFEENKTYDALLGEKYKVVKSTDYNKLTGANNTTPTEAVWPIWVGDNSYDLMKYGAYVYDNSKRNSTNFKQGPKIFSDEDIFTTYNDYDLDFYDGGKTQRAAEGYPLKLQFEQNIHTWSGGLLKDAMIVSFKVINTSLDTLKDCWAAPVVDYDISDYSTGSSGSANDHGRYFLEDDTLGLGIGWSGSDLGEAGKGFGYIGYSLLQTPAVELNGNLKKTKQFYTRKEQIGSKTLRNWGIKDDKITDDELYQFMASEMQDGDTGPSDKRAMLGTGPFNMFPNDTIKVVLLLNFAATVSGGEPDGSTSDAKALIDNKRAIDRFWNRYLTDVENGDASYSNKLISEIYPNPVTDFADVSFTLENPCEVTLDIVNLAGEVVATPVEKSFFGNGAQTQKIDLKNLNSGTYMLVMRAGNLLSFGKLQIVK